MQNKINAGDYVKHISSGEEWIVCGVNYGSGYLIPCGYPFPSQAKISDCVLTQRNNGQTQEMKDALLNSGFESCIEKE